MSELLDETAVFDEVLGLADDGGAGGAAAASARGPVPPLGERPRVRRWRSKASRTRRGFEIHGYIGANGAGKSLAMMHDTYLSIMRGRPILSTVRVLDPATGDTYAGYEQLTTWDQLLAFRGGDVLMDEVLGVAASMAGHGLPEEVQLLLNQLRRRDVLLRWTAPAWSRANIVLREVTKAVTVCRGYLPAYSTAEGDESRFWGQNRLFRWTTYDAVDFATWSDNKEATLKGKANAWFWRPRSVTERLYDTFDSVANVDKGEGYCFTCGGVRPKRHRPACTC